MIQTIRATKEIIASAKKGMPTQCILAQAIRVCGAQSVYVNGREARYNLNGVRVCQPLSDEIQATIREFDAGGKVTPFTCHFDTALARTSPVVKKPNAKKRGPTLVRRKPPGSPGDCLRRYHGKVSRVEKNDLKAA